MQKIHEKKSKEIHEKKSHNEGLHKLEIKH